MDTAPVIYASTSPSCRHVNRCVRHVHRVLTDPAATVVAAQLDQLSSNQNVEVVAVTSHTSRESEEVENH